MVSKATIMFDLIGVIFIAGCGLIITQFCRDADFNFKLLNRGKPHCKHCWFACSQSIAIIKLQDIWKLLIFPVEDSLVTIRFTVWLECLK